MDRQPVPRLERERLHPGQVEPGELGTAGEQEAAGPAGPVEGVVLDRPGVVGERDQPGVVGLVAADRLRVAGVQRPDRLEVGLDRRVEHVVFGAVLEHLDDLRLPGVRVQHRARHVRLGVLQQHLGVAGAEVDPDQPAGVRVDRADGQQGPAVTGEREHVAGRDVVGRDGEQRPPLVLRAVPDQHVEPAVGQRGDRPADHHVLVREPAGVPRVLDQLVQLAGRQREPVDVVQLRVVPVDPDQHLVAVALAGGDDPRLDAVERRQVAPRHRLHVDVVQPPVLVAAGVLQVQQVPAVPRPGEDPDTPVGVVGDHLRAVPVHAGGADRRDPHVEHPVAGSDPGQLAAVG